MQDTYGDPGVAAYYAPQSTVDPNYLPNPITTSDDLDQLSPQQLTQKINTDLDSYFNVSDILSNAQNVSPAVENSLNGFSDVLQNVATTQLDSYINNTVNTTNFNEDVYYTQVKSKVAQAFDNYMSNIGNNIGLTPNEQTSILVASNYTSLLIQTVDFRNDTNLNYQINNTLNSTLRVNAVKTNGFFSAIGNVFRRAAKIVAFVVVFAAVVAVSGAVGAFLGWGLSAIDPNFTGPNVDNFGVPLLSGAGGVIYGITKLFNNTRIWSWAWKR